MRSATSRATVAVSSRSVQLRTERIDAGWIVQEPFEGGGSVLAVEGEAPAHHIVYVARDVVQQAVAAPS